MIQIVVLQILATFIVAVIAAALGGVHAAVSAVLGGLACLLPNALFAWRLALEVKRPQGASPLSFFFGEFAKLMLTIAMLFAIGRYYQNLNWLALLAGFIVVLKSYFVAFLIDRHK